MAKPVIEETQFTVLRKLAQIGKPMNMLEIGLSASPQVIRNMAARGMVRVEVTLLPRGQEVMDGEKIRRKRKTVRERKGSQFVPEPFNAATAPDGNVTPIFVHTDVLRMFG